MNNFFNAINKQNITYIIIFLFILLSLIHLFNMKTDNNSNNEPFIVLKEPQIFDENIIVTIPSTDLVHFGAVGKSTVPNNLTTILNSKLGVDSNNMLIVPGTIRASKINVGIGGTPIRNTSNKKEFWPVILSLVELPLPLRDSIKNKIICGNIDKH